MKTWEFLSGVWRDKRGDGCNEYPVHVCDRTPCPDGGGYGDGSGFDGNGRGAGDNVEGYGHGYGYAEVLLEVKR